MSKQNKRKLTIQKIMWFTESNWNFDTTPENNLVKESKDGKDAEEAFFEYSEQGKMPNVVNDKNRFLTLLYGLRWMTTHEKMWREGFAEGTSHPVDFEDEPIYIKDMAKKACEQTGRMWNV